MSKKKDYSLTHQKLFFKELNKQNKKYRKQYKKTVSGSVYSEKEEYGISVERIKTFYNLLVMVYELLYQTEKNNLFDEDATEKIYQDILTNAHMDNVHILLFEILNWYDEGYNVKDVENIAWQRYFTDNCPVEEKILLLLVIRSIPFIYKKADIKVYKETIVNCFPYGYAMLRDKIDGFNIHDKFDSYRKKKNAFEKFEQNNDILKEFVSGGGKTMKEFNEIMKEPLTPEEIITLLAGNEINS